MNLSTIDFIDVGNELKMRYGIWRAAGADCKGSVLLLNGRAEFMEKHLETVCDLTQRGFDVYSLDWRGQGLSSRMLENPHKGHAVTFDDYIQDLALLVQSKMKTAARPVTILAHSMGAHIALRFIREHAGWADRAVLLSAMFDIHTFPFPAGLARWLARKAVQSGRQGQYAPGSGNYRKKRYLANRYTSDSIRLADEHLAIVKKPALAVGGVTYGWASAAFDSIDQLKAPGYAEAIRTPVLMISGQQDRVVRLDAQKAIDRRLPFSRLLILKDARHEILKECDAIRRQFWALFDRYCGKL